MITKREYLDIYEVVGAAMEVHKTFGRGMAEPLYQEALRAECYIYDEKNDDFILLTQKNYKSYITDL